MPMWVAWDAEACRCMQCPDCDGASYRRNVRQPARRTNYGYKDSGKGRGEQAAHRLGCLQRRKQGLAGRLGVIEDVGRGLSKGRPCNGFLLPVHNLTLYGLRETVETLQYYQQAGAFLFSSSAVTNAVMLET